MNATAVDAFMDLPRDRKMWGRDGWRILRNNKAFVEVEAGQEPEITVENWNRVVEPIWAVTGTTEGASTPAGYVTTYQCNGRSSRALYAGSRDDYLIDVLALSSVAKPDLDLRICKDSIGNSDHWYLPLTPEQWVDLELRHGADLVSWRFAQLPATLEAFIKLLSGA